MAERLLFFHLFLPASHPTIHLSKIPPRMGSLRVLVFICRPINITHTHTLPDKQFRDLNVGATLKAPTSAASALGSASSRVVSQ